MCNDRVNGKEKTRSVFEQIIAVSNRHLCSGPFLEQMERVCRSHTKAVILREKDLPEEEYALLARQVMRICSIYQVPCILHTYWRTALDLDCPSIHLPLALLEECRKNPDMPLDSFKQIGTSIHSVEDAVKAQKLGAAYVTAGHIYATDCKKGLPPRGLEFLRDVCRAVQIPVYAIGGIRIDQAQLDEIRECGAAGGCIMSGMMKCIPD